MKILILGANGFLGRHLADYAESKYKWEVIRADCNKAEKVNIIKVDITSYKDVFSLLDKIRPEIIINSTGVFRSSTPEIFYKTNCIGAVNIFESVLKVNNWHPRIIIFGSAAEYGFVKESQLPITEEFPLAPLGHYGISKAAQTFNALSYFNEGLDVYVGRIFNLLGAGLSDLLAPSSFAKQISEIELGGRMQYIATGNMENRRDFVDVSDVVKAVFGILEKGRKGEVYNICSGHSYSMKEIVDIFREISKVKFETKVETKRVKRIDIPDSYGDYTKLQKDTGWIPTVPINTSLQNLLESWRHKIRISN